MTVSDLPGIHFFKADRIALWPTPTSSTSRPIRLLRSLSSTSQRALKMTRTSSWNTQLATASEEFEERQGAEDL
jgi:hypothetical protein